jgi:hypothetical protein
MLRSSRRERSNEARDGCAIFAPAAQDVALHEIPRAHRRSASPKPFTNKQMFKQQILRGKIMSAFGTCLPFQRFGKIEPRLSLQTTKEWTYSDEEFPDEQRGIRPA